MLAIQPHLQMFLILIKVQIILETPAELGCIISNPEYYPCIGCVYTWGSPA